MNGGTLLTGLLKCDRCGAGMTVMTAKSGAYRYYSCNARRTKNNKICDCPNVRMERLDRAVLEALANEVFTPKRVETMLEELKKRVKKSRSQEADKVASLSKELDQASIALERLYEAVEKGALPPDETLQKRAQKLKARREALLTEIAGVRRIKEIPVNKISKKHVAAFSRTMRAKLLGEEAPVFLDTELG